MSIGSIHWLNQVPFLPRPLWSRPFPCCFHRAIVRGQVFDDCLEEGTHRDIQKTFFIVQYDHQYCIIHIAMDCRVMYSGSPHSGSPGKERIPRFLIGTLWSSCFASVIITYSQSIVSYRTYCPAHTCQAR